MADEPPAAADRPVGLGRAIRRGFGAYVEEIVLFFLVNLAYVLVLALFVSATVAVPLLVLAAPVLALPTAVLMRLAVTSARDGVPSWSIVRSELGRRMGRKLLLATAQLLVLGLGAANVSLASNIGGVAGTLSALVAGYALVASSVYVVALWPIVCDPGREAPLRAQLRLAMAIVLVRPFQVGLLALIAVLAIVASVQLIAPAIFLPSLVLLAIAVYVVDVADRLRPVAR